MPRWTAPLVLLLVGLVAFSVDARPPDKPNIIYIMLDDAGYGDFGAFGSKHVKTPTFDRLCAQGTKFTHHYSGSAVCAPTRCVLMTGLHTGHCRRRDNQAVANRDQTDENGLVFLKPEDVTVAEALKKAGYATAGIGKWGLGNPGSAGQPEKQGFDYWFGYLDQVHAHDHYPAQIWDGGRMVDLPGNARGKHNDYVPYLQEAKTLEFIRKHQDEPFFLYLAYTPPHGKYVIPQDDPACAFYKDKPWSQQVKNYAAMITQIDRTVGKVMALLEELDLDEQTIVFYTSDNGPNSPFVKPLGSAGPFRGIKRQLYEGGLRAAMAVRWPGRVPAGATSDFVWDMRDFFPTACDIAGAEAPNHLDGVSVLPTLLGKTQDPHDHLYWEIHHPFQQAVRMGPWKAIRFGTADPIALYNLEADPGESRNVANDHPQIVRRIEQIMDTSRTETPFWPAVEQGKSTPNRRR